MKCCICKKEIPIRGTYTEGCNAEPLRHGRCCYLCDDNKVIPARLRMMGVIQ